MQLQISLSMLLLSFFLTSPMLFTTAAQSKPQDLLRSSCIHSRYPRLCLRTLSHYPGPANTPLDMARAALRVSLAHTRRTSKFLHTLSKGGAAAMSKRQRFALRDCTEQISDSVDQLRRSLDELQHLRAETFRWQMSNAQTWVSAALTDGDTCLDGFAGNARPDVNRRVTDVARVTSNALYMINRLGQSRTGKSKPKARPRPKHRPDSLKELN
ncbi:pectinesterase inhibitor 3 [Vigna radiata var. radiata]|uniref:Pectinesterase inhibitor 3 n=1 Tax=Vigna radiata var. radiata TaxID=3916 RepID=A0A1S3U2M1_VIGRR|nr:pectinesterase inhibitor 3 [Vigna radiata var. radiata]